LQEGFYFGGKMEKRIGVIAIVIENINNANTVNNILHDYAQTIVGRMGIPYRERGVSVISLIVDGSMDEISAMTGKLGKIDGVTVKSAITKNLIE
jgi:putative iron-only hydrogenase system regulator